MVLGLYNIRSTESNDFNLLRSLMSLLVKIFLVFFQTKKLFFLLPLYIRIKYVFE